MAKFLSVWDARKSTGDSKGPRWMVSADESIPFDMEEHATKVQAVRSAKLFAQMKAHQTGKMYCVLVEGSEAGCYGGKQRRRGRR